MFYLNKSIKFFLYFLEIFLLFICSYLTIVLIGLAIPINSDYNPKKGEIEIFITSNGVHTDVCLPVQTKLITWTNFIETSPFTGLLQKPEFISIGWGDKGFFLDTPEWSDLTLSTALNAAFFPSSTAMHVAYLHKKPNESESIKRCVITQEKYEALISFIKHSFATSNNSMPLLIPDVGYTNFDNFYEADGNYHLFNTCNSWTNEALQIAGVKTSFMALSDKGILRHL